MTDWTKEQLDAINNDGQNIIVSAGAGSGKTAVLTERVIRKLKSGTNVNNLLILTFTNKAAAEMKDRIRSEITNNKDLAKELDYLDSSYITTFDSFSLSIVKKYSYLLNIDKNIKIVDSSLIHLETKRIIDEIFDKLYLEKNNDFLILISNFTVKNDDDIKKYIVNINKELDLKYNKLEYLDSYLENNYSDDNIDELVNCYILLLKDKIKEINKLVNDISYLTELDYYNKLEEVFDSLFNSETYEEIKENLDIKMPSLPRGSDDSVKEIKDSITDILKELKELTNLDYKELKETYLNTKSYSKIIIEIIKELDLKLNKFKKENNIYEFIDISKMGIKILKEFENVRLELKNYFSEIMIDEYQDTSDLQEEFISLISNNNVYVVGDIKQSIYRFRNANPYLFKEKYDNYSNKNGGIKIDLTNNFRSRKEVVNNINLLFSRLMNNEASDIDYEKSHKMIFGNLTYDGIGNNNLNNNLEIFNYEHNKDIGFTREEIEIFFIVKDIREKINSNYLIFDKKDKNLRPCKYSDFTILLDKSSYFDLFKKIFEYFSIPLTKYSSTNIIKEDEIVLIKNILGLIIEVKEKKYDINFKYYFTSIARSYLFEYTDQEIFDYIRNNNYKSSLLDKINKLVENIDSYSLKELIYEIIDKFEFYSKVNIVGDVNNRINRLISIINIFNDLASLDYDIFDAFSYLDSLIEDEYKLEVKELDVISNSVKIMTIHASKGLEFPICYFALFHSKFNISDLNDRFMYYKKYGIIAPYYNDGIGNTFVKYLVKSDYLKEEISEKIRLLYVALTRAKEKLIIVTSFKDKKISSILKASCFLDMLELIKDDLTSYVNKLDLKSLDLTKEYDLTKENDIDTIIEKNDELLKIKNINIENNVLNKIHISKENNTLLNKGIKDTLKFGEYLHTILENIDFNNPNLDIFEIDDYYKDKIKSFIKLINIDKVIKIYKELEFFYEKDDNTYNGIIDLILEYEDKISIIDYKLKNIDDDNYVKQINNYKDYLSSKTNKKIEIYLFSIVTLELKKL